MNAPARCAATVFAFLLVPALAACSNRPPDSQTSPAACVLSAQDVGRITRAPVRVAEADGAACAYTFESGERLTIEVYRNGARRDWPGIAAGSRLMGGGNAIPRPHVGDAAVWQAAGTMLFVKRGSAYIAIDLRAAPGNPALVGPAIASAAVSRL